MFGITIQELLSFFMQAGLALAGAAALWGAVFVHKRKHEPHRKPCLVFEWTAKRLMWPLVVGLVVAAVAWLLLSGTLPAQAHEGIVLERSSLVDKVPTGFMHTLFITIFALVMGWFALRKSKPFMAQAYLGPFYAIIFALTLLLISFPVWLGEFSRAQWFFIGHSAHSIFTLGTVLILDFLFLTAKSSTILKQHIYPTFPLISKVIWVGLGLDFLSVALVFPEAIDLTQKFFFMQTVVGILIINGVLLSGPITRKLIQSVKEGGKKLTKQWNRVGDVAGAISITSWITITFVDFFDYLSLGYAELFGVYASVIILGILGHAVWEKFQGVDPVVC